MPANSGRHAGLPVESLSDELETGKKVASFKWFHTRLFFKAVKVLLDYVIFEVKRPGNIKENCVENSYSGIQLELD